MEPDPLGQPADDQGDVRPAARLSLPVPGRRGHRRRARQPRRQSLSGRLVVALALVLVAASAAGAARVHGTRGGDRLQTVNGLRDVVSCGRGRDLATVDGRDRVARDCEVVTRQISRDPFRTADGQHETEVEPSSFGFGKSVVAVFQVGRIVRGGAHAIGFAISRDRGRTWRHGILPGIAAPVSDPVVTYDRRHGVWLAVSLAFNRPGSTLLISRSRDGIRWAAPVAAVSTPGFGQDKEWIGCDNWPRSPFFGRCYLSYSDTVDVQVVAQVSADGGLTWSAPATAPGFPGRASVRGAGAPGVQPVVLPGGRVVVPYYDEGRLSTLRSDDGGATWTAQLGIAPARYRSQRTLRAGPLPSAGVGADGRVYVAWSDCALVAGCSRNAIVYISSADGQRWTRPVRVPVGPGDAELPALALDPLRRGRIAISAYVVRRGALGVRFVASSNGGASWSAPQRLDSRAVALAWIARTSQGRMVGDYISTSFARGRAVPVFVLATRPTRGRLHEATFAASLPVR